MDELQERSFEAWYDGHCCEKNKKKIAREAYDQGLKDALYLLLKRVADESVSEQIERMKCCANCANHDVLQSPACCGCLDINDERTVYRNWKLF